MNGTITVKMKPLLALPAIRQTSLVQFSCLRSVWKHSVSLAFGLFGVGLFSQSCLAATAPMTRLGSRPAEEAPVQAAVFQDWKLACQQQTGPDKTVRCVVSQRLLNQRTHQQIVRISFQPLAHQVNGQVMLPFGLALLKGLDLRMNTDPVGQNYPFTTCRANGCIVPLDLDDTQMRNFQQARQVQLSFQLLNGREITVPISMRGFDEAWKRAQTLTGQASQTDASAP
ncbi:hypothetical protein E3202_05775 [Oecophyllibacter saccharovorans]|uniref:Invasion associated locus B family protein n=2 Tax=Oecophyllibacter saccharovorans TaxID=2558360 RepID=A0A506UL24_9PROT|nr:hypothetical protein E3202_05775 [Oecophyllibacter saccharovorans]